MGRKGKRREMGRKGFELKGRFEITVPVILLSNHSPSYVQPSDQMYFPFKILIYIDEIVKIVDLFLIFSHQDNSLHIWIHQPKPLCRTHVGDRFSSFLRILIHLHGDRHHNHLPCLLSINLISHIYCNNIKKY